VGTKQSIFIEKKKGMSSTISAIIVNYNAGSLLRGCVDSLLACPIAIEIIIVDNASHDESLDRLPALTHILVIRNPTNVGFAASCNIGIDASSTPFLLSLNPDCFFKPGAVSVLLTTLQSANRIGMVGGLLMNEDGSEQGGGRRAVPTPWRSFVRAFGLAAVYLTMRRLVALSSTSQFTKVEFGDAAENDIAARLIDSEARVQAWAEERGIERVVLRPTLIYGLGRDKNISEIACFINRFSFFPLLERAQGLRQPVHAEDVAATCVAALLAPAAVNCAYNISGGETLTYRDLVTRVFLALSRPARLVTVQLWAFRFAVAMLRPFSRYRHWSAAMAERMNRDLVFDHAEATRDLGFKPRGFALTAKDMPQ
jgi:glycosyltransferase involved in cell wall biosynthesis